MKTTTKTKTKTKTAVAAVAALLFLAVATRSADAFAVTTTTPAAPIVAFRPIGGTSTAATTAASEWASTLPPPRPSFTRLRAAVVGDAVDAATSASAADDDITTVQILMSDTGGGHRASANAIRDALNVLHPGKFQCDIVDIYTDYGPFFPYDSYVPLYKVMAEYSFLWDWFYHFGCTPFGLWLNEFCLEAFCFDPFKVCMERDGCGLGRRADMVVSVHPLCQDIPLKILTSLDTGGKSRSKGRTTPFVTVVTDLGGAHPTWFNPGVNKCFVPSDALYQAARDRKVEPSQIVQHGLPIRQGFWSGQKGEAKKGTTTTTTGQQNAKKGWFGGFFGGGKKDEGAAQIGGGGGGEDGNRAALRDELGLARGLPTVLIVGGGDGMGGIVEQASALGSKLQADAAEAGSDGPAFQMVVVCGKNEAAEKTLKAKTWGDGVKVDVKGFVYNMDEYMRASDAIVTKAGPGTIAEASICGLPCMLSSFLPGQEEGNVPYVEQNGFGAYSGDPAVIANTVSEWLETPEMLAQMKEKALEASRPSATLDIAKDLANIAFEHKGIKA